MGFTARTTNTEELSGTSRIAELWQKLMTSGNGALPEADEQSIFSVYTDYESDENGAYSVILGKRLMEEAAAPDRSRRTVHIPTANYVVFPAANATADSIKAAWQAVYRHFQGSTDTRRAFTFDFEEYSAQGVQLFIAVR